MKTTNTPRQAVCPQAIYRDGKRVLAKRATVIQNKDKSYAVSVYEERTATSETIANHLRRHVADQIATHINDAYRLLDKYSY